MRNAILLGFLCLIACKKPTTTPNNPNNPVTPIVYGKYRMPMPYWGSDTLVCFDSLGKRIDSIYAHSSNGLSYIKWNGSDYTIWLDTEFVKFQPYKMHYTYWGVSKTMTDTAIEGNAAHYTYNSGEHLGSFNDTVRNAQRGIYSSVGIKSKLNPKAYQGGWVGRER